MIKSFLLYSTILLFTVMSYKTIAQTDTITILHVNDTHSCLAPLGPRTITLEGTQGGISRAATIIGMTKMTEQNVLTLHAGDVFIGDFFFNKFYGVAEFQLMNQLGFNAMAVGNHEFDLTPATLDASLRNSFPPGSGFRLLSSNLILEDPTVQSLKDYIFPYTIKQFGNAKVGMFSLLTPETNLFSQPDSAVVDENIAEIAMAMVDTLTSHGCNLIICLSHLGIYYDQELAANIPGINIIVSGHDHYLTEQPIEVANPLGGTTFVVQADAFYKCIGKMKIVVSGSGMEMLDYSIIELDGTIPEEPTVKAIVDGLIVEIENEWGPVYTQQIGYATDFFEEIATNLSQNGPHDTPIGNLVTDAFRWKTGTEIAITVGGSTAQPIYEGPLVGADAFGVVGYGYNLVNGLGFRIVKFNLSGADIIAGLEFGLSTAEYNDELFPQVSGMSYWYNLAKPPYSRVEYVEVGGVPLDPQQIYSITSNEFLLSALESLVGVTIIDSSLYTDVSEFQVLSDYIMEHDTISPIYRGSIIADVKRIEEGRIPEQFRLEQNYPNPFNPHTTIKFSIPEMSRVILKVYDIIGNEVATLVNETKTPGIYSVQFNAADLSTGVYIYSLKAGSFVQTKKMILMK